MLRTIIQIDIEKCTGCGLCAKACHEGAIAIVDGKAKLMREDYCDGFGDCLPGCPTGAIRFIEKDAPAYDAAAVAENKRRSAPSMGDVSSQLANWPVQLKLVNPCAPWLPGCDLLLAADCTAFACGSFHRDFMAGKATIIACPKLDMVDYSKKLTEIFTLAKPKSLSIVRMQVPCCGGLVLAVQRALEQSGLEIPVTVVTLDNRGNKIM